MRVDGFNQNLYNNQSGDCPTPNITAYATAMLGENEGQLLNLVESNLNSLLAYVSSVSPPNGDDIAAVKSMLGTLPEDANTMSFSDLVGTINRFSFYSTQYPGCSSNVTNWISFFSDIK